MTFILFTGVHSTDECPGFDNKEDKALAGDILSQGYKKTKRACYESCFKDKDECCAGASYDEDAEHCKLFYKVNNVTVKAGVDSITKKGKCFSTQKIGIFIVFVSPGNLVAFLTSVQKEHD